MNPNIDSFTLSTPLQRGGLHLLLSPSHVFMTAPNDTLIICPTPTPFPPDKNETTSVTIHQGVHCSAIDESGLLCCCNDSQVTLHHWDSLLGEWEKLVVSEGEGRIGSVTLVGQGNKLWVAAFKWDTVVLYLITSVHPLTEPGPLLLESIQAIATLDKSKEPTISAHAFLGPNNTLMLLGLSNPLSLKMWEVQLHSGKGRLLKQQSSGISMKSIVASDILPGRLGEEYFLLLVSSEGAAEVFYVLSSSFSLLNRFRVADDVEPGSEEQSEWRILGAKFCCLGASDVFEQDEEEQLMLVPEKRSQFPQLLVIFCTSRGLSLLNAKSGHVLLLLPYHKLLGLSEGVVALEAAVGVFSSSGNPDQVTLAVHLVFSPTLHMVTLDVSALLTSAVSSAIDLYSLITSDALNAKSVLRKRFKSPPQPVSSHRRKSFNRRQPISLSRAVKPVWATKGRSRRRPSPLKIKKASSLLQMPPPASARSRSHSPTSQSLCNHEDSCGLFTPRPVPLPRKGSWEQVTDPNFGDRIGLSSGLMGGHSYLRIGMAPDGAVLAVGGSQSPVALMRSHPSWETLRLLKDISRVTSLHFNFHSNLLLVGTNDGRTRVLNWRKGKELLSWDFTSKFNEHVHAQFYFMDKFVLQPQLSFLSLYALREVVAPTGDDHNGQMLRKLLVANFPINAQSITAVAAPNLFLSSGILTGLSNKGLELFDVNTEQVSLSIRSAHSKPVTCIRLNEAPAGGGQTWHLSDLILTSCSGHLDPIKLWDLRIAAPVLRLSDFNSATFVPTARPAFSPCGRFIATGCEDNALVVYDTRRMQSRVRAFGPLKSTVLDCVFDPISPAIWGACRNGCFWKFS